MKNAAEEKSPGTRISPELEPLRGLDRDPASPAARRGSSPGCRRSRCARWRRRRAACARCGRGSGRCSITLVEPSASRPASSTHDFTWALATGSRYSIPRSGAPRTQRRQRARRATRCRRPSAAAARRPGRPAGGGSTRRRRASTRPRAGRRANPGSSRSSVPALPTSISAGAAPRRPDPVDPTSSPHRSPRPSSLTRPRAPARRRASSACRRRRGSPDPRLALAPSRRAIAARWEIDLSGGGVSVPRSGPAGSKRVIRRPPVADRRETTWPSSRTTSAARVGLARRRRPRPRSRRCACRAPGRAPCPRC